MSVTAPVAVSPGSASGRAVALSTLTPTLTWTAVTGVNGYQVRVLDRTDGVYAVAETVGATVTDYAVSSGKLLPGRLYTWSVFDLIGKAMVAPSKRLSFGTPVPPAPVAAPLVGTGSASRPVVSSFRPTVAWSAVADASGYVLHVTDRVTHAVITHTVSAKSTSYTFAAAELTPGHQYDWNVRDEIGTVTAKAVSNTEHFQMPTLPIVTTIGPGTTGPAGPSLTTFTPTFTWVPATSVGGFSDYQLTLYDRVKGTSVAVQVSPTATSYTVPTGQLIAAHRYVWNVRIVVGTLTGKVVASEFRYFVAPLAGG